MNLTDEQRYQYASDLRMYEVTEAHTWLRTEQDVKDYIKANFEDVFVKSIHPIIKGMDYTIYAWRSTLSEMKIRDRWSQIMSWNNSDLPGNQKDRGIRYRKPKDGAEGYAVWVNGTCVGLIRKAHIPAWRPLYPAANISQYAKPVVNGWEALVKDEATGTYRQVWHGFHQKRDQAAYQLFVAALDKNPFAIDPVRLEKGHAK